MESKTPESFPSRLTAPPPIRGTGAGALVSHVQHGRESVGESLGLAVLCTNASTAATDLADLADILRLRTPRGGVPATPRARGLAVISASYAASQILVHSEAYPSVASGNDVTNK